jgi:tRNA dimethylallyltransferase
MNKILVIVGPTAIGKTGLGIKLAHQFKGEIISADSRQVYKGMDIITGKDLSGEVKTWLLDVVTPDQKFSVADYYELAWKAIEDIWSRGKLPIVVGGTGFYIKALIEGIGTLGIKPDWELRKKLADCSINQLMDYLNKIDPERSQKMNESDRKNPRRIVRAIEVALKLKTENLKQNTNNYYEIDKLMIGLTAPNEILYQRIDQRVEERVNAGAEEEIKKLLDKGYTWENSVLGQTIGYCEWQEYFEGKDSSETVIQKWKFAEHDYARRQMTWFRKNQSINWFDITSVGWQERVEKLVKDWYI